MIKIFSQLTILSATLLFFSSCGSNPDGGNGSETTSANQEPKIRQGIEIWQKNDPTKQYTVIKSNVRPSKTSDIPQTPQYQGHYLGLEPVTRYAVAQAKKLGADAIIIEDAEYLNMRTGEVVSSNNRQQDGQRVYGGGYGGAFLTYKAKLIQYTSNK